MVQTEMSSRAKRMVSVAQISMMLLMTVASVSWSAQEENEIKSKCTFTRYLENPDNRIRYENTFAKARAGYAEVKNYENAAMYGVIVKAGIGVENGENLDSFSAGCLSCHDGASASNVTPVFKSSPGKKGMMTIISGKHPIGMDYQKYSESNQSLKSLDEMGQNLTLVEGRVSCITCHDPLNSDRYNLRVASSNVDLCFACHKG